MINLIKPENELEANVIKALLEDHGINTKIVSFHDTAYDGLYQAQYGWGVIQVSKADFLKAQKIIEEWRNAPIEELPWESDKNTEEF